VNGRLAAGAQLPQQPLLGGLPVQVGHMLGDDLVTADDVHGACLSGFDPAVGSFSGGAFNFVSVLGRRGASTSVRRTDIGTHAVWVAPVE